MNKSVTTKSERVYIAGHKGLVGSALHREFKKEGYSNIITSTRDEFDLRNLSHVEALFEKERPEWVLLAAAKVGGIYANSNYPVEFLLDNLKIQNNIIECSFRSKVKKLIFLGSSCIYPKLAPQPLKEEYLLTSKLEETNEAYALAKIAGIKLCQAYNKQYGTTYLSVMPCNLYGYNDNYHKENSHVLPALIRRFHEAKVDGKREVIVWGSGTPKRELMFADDLAKACLFLIEKNFAFGRGESATKEVLKDALADLINIGTGIEYSIADIAKMVKKIVKFDGEIEFDISKPDGTPQKILDISKITSLGWRASMTLENGIGLAYQDFLAHQL